jgi:hypothetical protein
LTDLILYEILQGIRGDSTFTRLHRDLSKFEVFDTGGEPLAVASAQNYRFLRSRDHTVRKTIDCLIATFCLTERTHFSTSIVISIHSRNISGCVLFIRKILVSCEKHRRERDTRSRHVVVSIYKSIT